MTAPLAWRRAPLDSTFAESERQKPHVGAPIGANGNLTAGGTRTFEWDAENRLVAVYIGTQRSEFTYDGEQRRVRMVEKANGATVRDANLFWAGTAIIEERPTTGEVNRFFTDGKSHNGSARDLTRDHLGASARLPTAPAPLSRAMTTIRTGA